MKCRLTLLLLIMLSLVSCSSQEELLGGFDVNEAIEIMVVLRNSSIQAEVQKSSRGREEKYSITVPHSDKANAFRLLNDYQLPRKHQEDFNTLTASEGFVPNLREISQLRMDRALGVEIERLLSGFEGVVETHAIIRSNLIADHDAADETGDSAKKHAPSASITIRFVSRSGNQPFTTDEVKRTVAKSVPGLSVDDVSISATRIVTVPSAAASAGAGVDGENNPVPLAAVAPFAFRVPAQDKNKVLGLIIGLLVLFVISGFVIGFYVSRWLRPARQVRGAPPKAVRTAMLEASFRTASGTTVPSVPGKAPGPPTRSPGDS